MLGLRQSFFGKIDAIRGNRGCFENRRPLLALAAAMLTALLLALPAVAQDESEGEGTPKKRAGPGSTGSFSQSIAIAVPGFHGIEPSLSISYDSGNGNGKLGVGWYLGGLSTIERTSLRDGTPRYDTTDIFLLDGDEVFECPPSGATGASCTTGGTHTTEIESYLRIKRFNTSPDNYWVVTATDGTKYTYRAPSTWGSHNTGNTDSVKRATDYRWLLAEVTDTHGNTVTYSYLFCDDMSCPDDNTPLIDTISYNGNSVEFYWESRVDVISYATGAGLAELKRRLKSVDVKVGADRLRAYALTYRGVIGGFGLIYRSRLEGVQEFGRDAGVDGSGTVSGGTSLPATTFGYPGDYSRSSTRIAPAGTKLGYGDFDGDGRTDRLSGLGTGGSATNVWMWNGTTLAGVAWPSNVGPPTVSGSEQLDNLSYQTADFNGDGLDDVLITWRVYEFDHFQHTGGDTIEVWEWHSQGSIRISTGASFTTVGAPGFPATWKMLATVPNVGPADLNGDGMADLVQRNGCPAKVAISNGTSFTVQNWSFTGCSTAAHDIADLNGDGKMDMLFRGAVVAGPAFNVKVRLSTGTGFIGETWTVTTDNNSTKTVRGDYNGDGMTDLAQIKAVGTNTVNMRVFLSTGRGFVYQEWGDGLAGQIAASGGACCAGAADVNGDGRDDIVMDDGSGGTDLAVLLSDGSSWFESDFLNDTFTAGPYNRVDVNGDGLDDVTTSTNAIYLPDGPFLDILTSVTNGLGGTKSIAYQPSSAFPNTHLPFVMQTVSSITQNDGREDTSTTSYVYAWGKWSSSFRRFLGFGTVQTNLPCNTGETVCPDIITDFDLDPRTPPLFSNLMEREFVTGDLITRRERSETYSSIGTTIPYTVFNTGSYRKILVGDDLCCQTFKTIKATRTFDTYGNIIEETSHGDDSVTGDEITTRVDFYPNTTDYIVGLPGRVRTHAGVGTGGTLLTDSYSYYDGAAAYTTPPVKGDVTQSKAWRDLPASGFVTSTAAYDTFGNVTSTTDPVGGVTTMIYDTTYHLFPTEIRDPLYATDTRHKALTSWDFVCGLPLTVTDLNSQVTTNTYDDLCRSTRTQSPNGNFALTAYNNIGTPTTQNVRTVTPKPGATTMPTDGDTANLFGEAYMDGLGRTYRTVAKGPTNIETLTTFTKRGAVASQTAPFYAGDTQYATTWKYDGLDRKIERQHPDTNKVTGAYGLSAIANGFQMVTATDELLRPATVHTDAYGRTIRSDRQLSAATVSTSYQYDLLGRLTGLTDNAGNQWTYTYDSLGRRLTANDPDLGNWTYVYDDAGRLTDQTDAKLQVTHLTYDALGRVLTKTAKYGTGSPEATTYTYDEARATYYNVGQLTTAANAAATIAYDFDKDGRQVRQQYVVDSTTHTITDTYDIGGRLLSRTYPDSDSVGTIAYDAAGRLKSVPSLVSDTLYNARSQVTSLTRVNAVNSTYSYSAQRGFLTGVSTVKGATVLQDYTYGRDARGRITGVTSSQAGEGWTYGYDDMDRLLSADNTTDNSLDQTWTYDSVDNMLTNSRAGTYTYPAPGSARPHAVTAITGGPDAMPASYVYDANGAMTNQGSDTRTYDGEGRLVSAVDGATTTQFVYGPDGARLKKIVGATTTLYLGADIEKTSTTWTKYLPGDAKRVGTGGAYYWMLRDHLQSVRVETDSAGIIVNSSKYRPFGDRVAGVTTIAEAKGFIGERHDPETGLMYLNARYYDPVLGRFMSADPMSPTLPGVGVNRYAYAFNSPIIMLDPSGLEAEAYGGRNYNGRQDGYGGPRSGCTCMGAERGYAHEIVGQMGVTPGYDKPTARASYGWQEVGGWFGFDQTPAVFAAQSYSPDGIPYSPDEEGWHDYMSGPNVVCPGGCTEEEIADYMSRFAVPGQDPSKPIVDGGIYHVYDPELGIYAGDVVSTITNNGLTITNTTLPGHIFFDGEIVRNAWRNADGSWSVTTHGYGNNQLPGANHLNQTLGPETFDIIDRRMRDAIVTHHGGYPGF